MSTSPSLLLPEQRLFLAAPFLASLLSLSCFLTFAFSEDAASPELTTPPTAPAEVLALLDVDDRGGTLLRPEGLDFTHPKPAWKNQPGARLQFEKTYAQFGSHRLELENPLPADATTDSSKAKIQRELWSENGIQLKTNRNYIVSVLVKTDFPRNSLEANISLRFFDADGNRAGSQQMLGLPSKTEGPDGWQRLEWEVTVPEDPDIHEGRASLFISATHFEDPVEIRIADIAFVELPAKPLIAPKRGEGVTFSGGVGDLPMKVESAEIQGERIIVETTGARFEFDTAKNTIEASQRIDFARPLASWESSLSLADLRIDENRPDVCILSNKHLTIGIQADSMMAISPHEELNMKLTNRLGGDFNRYARGHLYSTDDFGGITVNPYLPPGSGRTARSELITRDLSFADFKDRDYDSTGTADPDWEARWTSSPGELLCTSVFPPRPYPWKESFRAGWRLVHHYDSRDVFNKEIPFMDTWLLWDFIPKTWGHSYSNEYEPYDEAELHQIVEKAHKKGQYIMPFMSAYWTPSRDANVYIQGVKDFKDKYDIDGIYSDGLPAIDWLLAYREMRMLRELFPSGRIVVHDSFRQSHLAISQFKPFLYTYATFSYMAEGEPTNTGIHWQFPRYVTSMFRKTNNLGVTKGDAWLDEKGEEMGERRALVDALYNGRNHVGYNWRKYHQVANELKALWEEKGDDAHFYDRYYLPKAQELTGYRIGRTAMPIVESEKTESGVTVTLRCLTPGATIHYTTDGSVPSVESPAYTEPISLDAKALSKLRSRAFSEGLDPSAVSLGE